MPLPLVRRWMLLAYGYDASVGLPGAVVLAAIVLPWSRWVSTPEKNINWTWGLGREQARLSPLVYLGLLLAGFVLLVFIPTDWLLRNLGPGLGIAVFR